MRYDVSTLTVFIYLDYIVLYMAKITTSVRIDEEIYSKLLAYCKLEGYNRSALIQIAITKLLQDRGKKNDEYK